MRKAVIKATPYTVYYQENLTIDVDMSRIGDDKYLEDTRDNMMIAVLDGICESPRRLVLAGCAVPGLNRGDIPATEKDALFQKMLQVCKFALDDIEGAIEDFYLEDPEHPIYATRKELAGVINEAVRLAHE